MKLKLLLVSLFLPLIMTAQIKLQGTVTAAADGEPLIGVTVKIAGTNVLTVTDIDGHYAIDAKNAGKLEISYIGCRTKVIPFTSSATIDAVLEDDVNQLDEVVVIGYGTMKKSDLTGSVASISAENLKKTPAANTAGVLDSISGISLP